MEKKIEYGDPQLLQLIGTIAVNWSALELMLDLFSSAVFHRANGSSYSATIPMGLRQKTSLIKKCLRDFAPLSDFEESGAKLMAEINSTSNDRNWLLHGMLSICETVDKRGYEFRKVNFRASRTIHTFTNRRFTLAQIKETADLIHSLRVRTMKLLLQAGDKGLNLWIDQTTD